MVPRRHKLRYLNVYRDRHGKCRVYLKRNGVRVPLRQEPGSPAFMAEYWDAYLATEDAVAPFPDAPAPTQREGRAAFVRVAERLAKFARSRAASRRMECTIDAQWVIDRIEEQEHRCKLTGLQFKVPGAKLRGEPLAPSLDRIDNAKGYTPDNVRVVALAVNVAMNHWGYDTLLRISKAVTRQHNANKARP